MSLETVMTAKEILGTYVHIETEGSIGSMPARRLGNRTDMNHVKR